MRDPVNIIKAKRIQLTIVRNLLNLNKKPINIIGICLKNTRNKNAINITKNPIQTTWNLMKMNSNQY